MTKHINVKKLIHLAFILAIMAILLLLSISLTQFVTTDESSQLLIQEYGYIGVLLISFIAGLNLLIPIPAASFIPIFTAGGISLLVAIPLLVAGTMCANLFSYVLGRIGNDFTNTHYPNAQKKIEKIYLERKEWLPYFVFVFAALSPIPNEVYLIPLGIIGVKLREFILPLFLGTIFFQSMTALGFENIFRFILN